MDRQVEFDRVFCGLIERFRDLLVGALRAIIRVTPPAQAACLLFEIYSDWRQFPVSTFAFDRDWNEVSVGTPLDAVRVRLAGELIPKGAIDQDAYEDAGVATFESGARILADLFHECWRAAGGEMYPLPAYAKHHDRGVALDLKTGEWVDTRRVRG